MIESAFGGTKWFALNVNDAMATSLEFSDSECTILQFLSGGVC